MSGVHISIEGLEAIARGMQAAPEAARRELLAAATEAVMLAEREVKERMPRVSGLTANSIAGDAFSTPTGVLGTVGSSQPSAIFVELGTRPHMPPVDALVPWVREALGVEPAREREVAFLVARKIAKHGTQAQRPFALTAQAVQGQITRLFEDAAARIAAHLAQPAPTAGGSA